MKTKQVIILRKDLNMRKGKMVAQGAHASMGAILSQGEKVEGLSNEEQYTIYMGEEMKDWLLGMFTKVCVGVNSEQELLDLYNQAFDAGLVCSLIQDKGLTEFGGQLTYTAVAIGPAEASKVDAITGHLKLL